MITCFTGTALETDFKERVKDISDENIQREIGRKLVLESHKNLHKELNDFKKGIGVATEKYVSPVDKNKIKEVNERYDKLISEANAKEAENKKPPVETEDVVNDSEGKSLAAKTKVEDKPSGSKQEAEESKPAEKTISEKGKELADRIRQLKTKHDKLQTNIFGIPIAIYDGMIETVATAVEGGANLAQAIKNVIKDIKDTHAGFQQEDFIKHIEDFAEGKKPRIKVQVGEEKVAEEKPERGIKHASTAELRKKYGLDEYERETNTDVELEALADKAIKDGYNPEDLISQLERGDPPTGVENFILKKYLATLEAKFDKSPTDENLAPIERLVKATDRIGTLQSEQFRTRKGLVPVDDSLAGYFITERELNLDAPLTDAQKAAVIKEYEDIAAAEKAWDKERDRLNKKIAKLKSEKALSKIKPFKKTDKSKPKTHDDYVNDRDRLKEKLKAQIEEYKASSKKVGIAADGGAEGFVLTAKMANTIGEIVKSHVDEIGNKLGDVVKRTFDDVKDFFEGITEDDIHDVIAGEYVEKQKPKSQLAKALFELKVEAKLINRLIDLENNVPKTKKEKIQRNQQITALRNKIKELNKEEKEANKFYGESDAGNRKIEKMEDELQRLKDRKEKEPSPKEEKEISAREKKLKEQIAAERKAFNAEKAKEDKNRLAALKKNYAAQIKKVEEDLRTGKFLTPEPPPPPIVLDAEALAAKDKLIKLKNERHFRILMQQHKNLSTNQKIVTGIAEVLNIPRTLMTIVDYSAMLRQGLIQTISHPSFVFGGIKNVDGKMQFEGAAYKMLKAGASQKVYDRWFYDLKETPRYELMERSKLGITDSTNPLLSAREEGFMSNLAEKIPIVGKTLNIGKVKIPGTNLVKGSERAYSMFLNKLRVDVFNRFADAMEERGLTYENSPEAFDQMAEYVNNSTGRGSLGKTLNKVAPLLNSLFFSPRLIASRLNMLTYLAQPRFYTKVPREVRAAYFKDMAKFIGVGMTVLALASLGGDDDETTVETDPRSSDFGKIKNKNTRWDIWGGFQQYIRVAAQTLMGERKKANGKISKLDGKHAFGEDKTDVLLKFGRGKLAPVPSMALDLFTGHTQIGDEVIFGTGKEGDKQITIGRYLKEHMLPLTYTGLEDATKDQGVKALFTVGIPSVLGVGTQTYDSKKGKNDSKKIKPYHKEEK